jgi:beta-glucosidase-like glycosyl hydrolase
MLQGKLRGDFNFEGIVATDCGALEDADNQHNYSTTVCPACNTSALRGEKISQLALDAGVNSNCGSYLGDHMPEVIARKMVAIETLHASTARLLTHRFKLGMFEPSGARFSTEIVTRGCASSEQPWKPMAFHSGVHYLLPLPS